MSETTTSKLRRKLDAAQDREDRRFDELAKAAHNIGHMPRNSSEGDALAGAAKSWTNAMHQRSRCEKHLREATRRIDP